MLFGTSSSLRSLLLRNIHRIAIETSKTPNPNFLKFIPVGHVVLGDQGTLDISGPQFSDVPFPPIQVSPLAKALFTVPGVTRVFYGSDYLSVAKQEQVDWDALKPEIFRIVSKHFDEKIPLLTEQASLCIHANHLESDDIDPNDPEVVQFIKEIIANRIRPNVQEDGGDVHFLSFD